MLSSMLIGERVLVLFANGEWRLGTIIPVPMARLDDVPVATNRQAAVAASFSEHCIRFDKNDFPRDARLQAVLSLDDYDTRIAVECKHP